MNSCEKILFFGIMSIMFLSCRIPADSKQAKTFKNSIGMTFIEVKSGTFTYGAAKDTPRANLWRPRFEVKITLTKDYWLSNFEVTQEQFEKVMGTNPSHFKGKDRPVDSVTWHEAVEFCRKLSEMPAEKKAGRVYSLPSSAEWEYACRAGTESVFPWGNEDETAIGAYAWCRDWYGKRATETHPVGQKKANNWGFHDMLGNVWEWCSDSTWIYPLQACTYYFRKDGWIDPQFPLKANDKKSILVIRGGGWKSDFRSANSFMVTGQKPLYRDDDTGFRVKCTIKKNIANDVEITPTEAGGFKVETNAYQVEIGRNGYPHSIKAGDTISPMAYPGIRDAICFDIKSDEHPDFMLPGGKPVEFDISAVNLCNNPRTASIDFEIRE